MELKTYQSEALATLVAFLSEVRKLGIAASFAKHASPDARTGIVPVYRPLSDKGSAPLDALLDTPYVAIRIPTGGGKTLMGAHFIRAAAETYLQRERPLVVWLVPSRVIKQQTLDAFRNHRHPYRMELDDAFGGRVSVFDADDVDQLTPQELATKTCIVIATLATARVQNVDIRDFYADKESLESHFIGLARETPELEQDEGQGRPRYSFANLLKLHRPLVITDEAHNAKSELSGVLYERLAPSAIIELTATPSMTTSNVLVRVSASQLFAEQMIKLPVLLEEHLDGWDVALRHALLRRQELEEVARREPDYIRPILLVQAEHAGGDASVQAIYDHLISDDGERIHKDWIRIATGNQRELDDVDLFAPDCDVRIIITMEALKEGWDCAFAYVLCSVSGTKSATAIEQLLGRVLRMPYAETRQNEALNKAYAHVVSPYFGAKAVEFTGHLEDMGFSRLEAAESLPPVQPSLDGMGEGGPGVLRVEVVKVTTVGRPDLASVPAADLENISIAPGAAEGEFDVLVRGVVSIPAMEAISRAVPKKHREEAVQRMEMHNARASLRVTPAQAGVVFEVPQLSIQYGRHVLPAANDLLLEQGFWNPDEHAGTLDNLTFDTRTQVWEIGLGEASVKMSMVPEPSVTYLAGLTGDWEEADLVVWLDGKLRQPNVKQEAMVAWISRALAPLKRKGYSLGQLVRGRFIIARRLAELLDEARATREGAAYQLIFTMPEVVVDPSVVFSFSSLAYPKRWDCPAPYEWKKHYYAVPGDLPYLRADKRTLAEEYLCAMAIERCAEIDLWVRNLSHPTQFRLPTATGFTYPDFIARLTDGRILVIEYKGEDRYESSKNQAKRAVGELWAGKNPRGVYLMARLEDDHGRDLDEQIKAAIAVD